MATTRLKHQIIEGPAGETVKVSWMPGNRIRLDFKATRAMVTKIFPDPKGDTHVEIGLQSA